jgi:hypothetical protein
MRVLGAADRRGDERIEEMSHCGSFEDGLEGDPYRGRRADQGRALVVADLDDVARLRVGPAEDLRGAVHHAREGHAPRVGVEHGHDVEDHIALADAEHVHRGRAEAVQVDPAVSVEHALGMPGRPRGVAHARGVGLAEGGPGLDGPGSGEERLVIQRALGNLGGGRILHHDDVLHALEVLADGLEKRPEARVHDEDLVLGVVDDVGQVLGREADVDGVQHHAHEGRGEVDLHVAVGIPREGAHAVALLERQAGEGGGEPAHPLRVVGVGVTL